MIELVSPAKAVEGNQLESAGLALIAAKEVAQVESSQQVNIGGVDECLAFAEKFLVALEIHITVQGESEDGGQVLADTNAELWSQGLEETVVAQFFLYVSCDASIETDIPVVAKLTAGDGSLLCKSSCRKHDGCQNNK